jgi:DNA-binding NarL/FixJ family response regulator
VHARDSGFGLAMAIRELDPDVVVLDVNMPGLSGTGSLRATSALAPTYVLETRVLLHSGSPPDELEALATRECTHGWLAKPARPHEIVDAVAACLCVPRRPLGASR